MEAIYKLAWLAGALTLAATGISVPIAAAVKAPARKTHPTSTQPLRAPVQSGRERWLIRMASDPAARSIVPKPVETTVEQLIALPRPKDMPADRWSSTYESKRVSGVETVLWTVEADIVQYRQEETGDYSLVLQGASGQTMVAVIPDPNRVDRSSSWRDQINTARQQFAAAVSRQPGERARRHARITGIGFFDVVRGQVGMAPNGIELRPVVTLRLFASPLQQAY